MDQKRPVIIFERPKGRRPPSNRIHFGPKWPNPCYWGVYFLGEKGPFLFISALIFRPSNPATTRFPPSQPPSPRPNTPTRPNTPSPLQRPSRDKSLLLGVSRERVKSLLLEAVYYWGGLRYLQTLHCRRISTAAKSFNNISSGDDF